MRLKTLNGAPLPQHLDFGEDALFGVTKCDAFVITSEIEPTDTASVAKWRHIRVDNSRLRTGWSQPYLPGSARKLGDEANSIIPHIEETSTFPEFESTRNDTTMDFEESSMSDPFLEHSLVFHDTLLSSQVALDTVADETISSSSFLTTSFGTSVSEPSSLNRTDGQILILQVSPKMLITPLGSMPSAQHLRHIYPQTPTPNVLCVLMAPPERREVYIRRGGYNMDLYEITVADDTSSGFKVTFWIRPPRESNNEQSNTQEPLLQILENLHVGDTLLLRNIALTSFRDTVHGQSLNPSIARARTTIDVLMKSTGVTIGKIEGLPEPVVQAFQRVKRWARTHVAAAEGGSRKRRGTSTGHNTPGKRRLASSRNGELLPPDTFPG
ncbi:hypothetical protein HBI53_025270 [Parastagonospora nodorum]|nr:hypothetical protein HBI53_025270 [Parastagonospora nodorum]KAH6528413.1 hypothetical protein HBI07_184510 [Parastagonospora nodorum]